MPRITAFQGLPLTICYWCHLSNCQASFTVRPTSRAAEVPGLTASLLPSLHVRAQRCLWMPEARVRNTKYKHLFSGCKNSAVAGRMRWGGHLTIKPLSQPVGRGECPHPNPQKNGFKEKKRIKLKGRREGAYFVTVSDWVGEMIEVGYVSRVDSLRIASLNSCRCNLQAFYNRGACGAEREVPREKGEIEGGCESQNRLFQMIRDPRTLEGCAWLPPGKVTWSVLLAVLSIALQVLGCCGFQKVSFNEPDISITQNNPFKRKVRNNCCFLFFPPSAILL